MISSQTLFKVFPFPTIESRLSIQGEANGFLKKFTTHLQVGHHLSGKKERKTAS